eukprot:7390780-Prymnesium_polylepis.3
MRDVKTTWARQSAVVEALSFTRTCAGVSRSASWIPCSFSSSKVLTGLCVPPMRIVSGTSVRLLMSELLARPMGLGEGLHGVSRCSAGMGGRIDGAPPFGTSPMAIAKPVLQLLEAFMATFRSNSLGEAVRSIALRGLGHVLTLVVGGGFCTPCLPAAFGVESKP